MLVVVAGIKRSGSTWAFNVARVAMKHAGIQFEVGEYDLYASKPGGPLLIKSHWWHANLARDADVILSSERDAEEVYDSLRRFWGRPPTGREMAKLVEHHRRWHRAADYRMRYADLLETPRKVVNDIVAALGIYVDAGAVFDEVSALEPPAEGQDPTTLYFSNHRTST